MVEVSVGGPPEPSDERPRAPRHRGEQDRAGGDGRSGRGVAVPGEEQAEQYGEASEACGEQHDERDAPCPVGRGDGRPEEEGHDEQGADGAVRGDDREGHEADEHRVGESRPEAHGLGDPAVEGEGDERAVECDRDAHGDEECDGEAHQVRGPDGEDVAEEDRREVGGERSARRHDDDPRASMPTKRRPIEVSWDSLPRRETRLTPAVMTTALTAAPATGGRPRSAAVATPGSMPWAIASPRNARPRRTTQVPTTPQTAATSRPPTRARRRKAAVNGSVIQVMVEHST